MYSLKSLASHSNLKISLLLIVVSVKMYNRLSNFIPQNIFENIWPMVNPNKWYENLYIGFEIYCNIGT